MALDAIVESLDSVPEAIRHEYKPLEDGTFVLDVRAHEGKGYALENVSGLKSSLTKERQRASALENQNKRYAAYQGKDIDAAFEALDKYEQFKNFDPTKEADKIAEAKVKANLETISKKYDQTLAEKDTKLSVREKQLQKVLIENAAHASLAKQGVTGGQLDLLVPHVLKYLRLVENSDGEFVPTVVDDHGNPRIGNMNGDNMTVEQLVNWMKDHPTYSLGFPASNKSGGGTPQNNGGRVVGSKPKSQMTIAERVDFIKLHGEAKFHALPA